LKKNYKGSIGTTFYIILNGSVEIWVNIPKTVNEVLSDGKSVPKTEMVLTNVKVLTAGDSFGELALIDNRPRAATIKCRENCHLAILEKNHFNKILSKKF
jgi:CRP-like cAMP-binding protein